MAFRDRLYGQVDFVFLRCSWPQCKEEQRALLCNINGRAWRQSGGDGVENYLDDHHSRIIAKLSLQTHFGHRWFHVWRDPKGTKLLVVKEPAPDTPVVVSRTITVKANHPGIHADFTLLSGYPLGTRAFENISPENPLLAWDLKSAACNLALDQGLLESRHQIVGLTLPGFENGFPDGLLLAQTNTLTDAELQRWLSYLKALANEPTLLEQFHCLEEDSCSSSSTSSDVRTDESPTSCNCEEL